MAKLVRDRSTRAKDQWWSDVARAAESAPTLTYEMESAPMANSEDVLERAESWLRHDAKEPPAWLVARLADMVRELRRDRARLEAGLRAVSDLIAESKGVYGLHLNGDVSPWDELRGGGYMSEWLADFDAAMGGGEKLDGE